MFQLSYIQMVVFNSTSTSSGRRNTPTVSISSNFSWSLDKLIAIVTRTSPCAREGGSWRSPSMVVLFNSTSTSFGSRNTPTVSISSNFSWSLDKLIAIVSRTPPCAGEGGSWRSPSIDGVFALFTNFPEWGSHCIVTSLSANNNCLIKLDRVSCTNYFMSIHNFRCRVQLIKISKPGQKRMFEKHSVSKMLALKSTLYAS